MSNADKIEAFRPGTPFLGGIEDFSLQDPRRSCSGWMEQTACHSSGPRKQRLSIAVIFFIRPVQLVCAFYNILGSRQVMISSQGGIRGGEPRPYLRAVILPPRLLQCLLAGQLTKERHVADSDALLFLRRTTNVDCAVGRKLSARWHGGTEDLNSTENICTATKRTQPPQIQRRQTTSQDALHLLYVCL